jgi:hypothetical protein
VPPLPAGARVLLYAVAGGLFGFLFLAEFALATLVATQVTLLALALVGCVAVARRWPTLELWPVFVAAALVAPLIVDARVVGLPRCDGLPQGLACFAGTRDVATPFAIGVVAFAAAIVGILLLIAREIGVSRAIRPR